MNGTPDFVIFLGRFHPLIVHMPIGILTLAFLMELLSRREKFKSLGESTSFVLFWGAVSAWGAVVLGLMLSQGGGYNESTLFWHKWLGIGLAIGSTVAWWIKSKKSDPSSPLHKAYLPLLALSMLFLMIGGHNGGSLTHGSDYLVQYAPQPIKSLVGVKASAQEEIIEITDLNKAKVFDELIHPMVRQRCKSCHNEDKMKGGLRLDTREKFLKEEMEDRSLSQMTSRRAIYMCVSLSQKNMTSICLLKGSAHLQKNKSPSLNGGLNKVLRWIRQWQK